MKSGNLLLSLLASESTRREVTEIALKIILTLILTLKVLASPLQLDFSAMGNLDLMHVFTFLLSGKFVAIIAFFFLFWYLFHGVVSYFTTIPAARLATSVRNSIRTPKAIQQPISEKQIRRNQRVNQFLLRNVFFEFSNNAARPGPILQKLANDLKRAWSAEPEEFPFDPIVSPTVILQFAIVYFTCALPFLHGVSVLTVILSIFGLVFFLTAWASQIFIIVLKLYQHEFVKWVESYDSREVLPASAAEKSTAEKSGDG